MTKFQLASLLFAKTPTTQTIIDNNGCKWTGIVSSIQREDGSGRSFNVTMNLNRPTNTGKTQVTVYVVTTD